MGQLVGPLLSAAPTALKHRLVLALYVAGGALLIAGLLV
ncbi:putative membrane protein [Candidatus Erwinia dacicola]|uniref:Membrane protein n=1 Tax=Candidatus Erwinia dacicola TaxID=252393 RepID=A0A328TT21_9GAMM|nr:putative membrane protein [Candidatus Erwinia dacicola]